MTWLTLIAYVLGVPLLIIGMALIAIGGWGRDDAGRKLVTVGVRCLMWTAEKVAGNVTYPAAGLADAIDALDGDTFGDFCSEGGTERVADFLVGEAEAYYEDAEWRRGCER